MAQLSSSFKTITFAERTLLGLTLVGLMVRYFFNYEGTLFLEVFTMALALLYFPFGFYSIGKPSAGYSYTTPIILGFVYALGIIVLLLSAVNIDSYRYPLITYLFILLAIIIYLLLKLRSAAFPKMYINTQFVRIGFIVLSALIILLK